MHSRVLSDKAALYCSSTCSILALVAHASIQVLELYSACMHLFKDLFMHFSIMSPFHSLSYGKAHAQVRAFLCVHSDKSERTLMRALKCTHTHPYGSCTRGNPPQVLERTRVYREKHPCTSPCILAHTHTHIHTHKHTHAHRQAHTHTQCATQAASTVC